MCNPNGRGTIFTVVNTGRLWIESGEAGYIRLEFETPDIARGVAEYIMERLK